MGSTNDDGLWIAVIVISSVLLLALAYYSYKNYYNDDMSSFSNSSLRRNKTDSGRNCPYSLSSSSSSRKDQYSRNCDFSRPASHSKMDLEIDNMKSIMESRNATPEAIEASARNEKISNLIKSTAEQLNSEFEAADY